MFRISTILFLSLCAFSKANAIPIRMDFSTSGFTDIYGPLLEPPTNTPAPDDPVSGSIVWEALSISDPIQSIISIDLTIDGHVYSAAELGFVSRGVGNDLIGGDVPRAIREGTDDFVIQWNRHSLIAFNFAYASSSTRGGLWQDRTIDSFSVTEVSSVPLPGTLVLFSLGLMLGGVHRKGIGKLSVSDCRNLSWILRLPPSSTLRTH